MTSIQFETAIQRTFLRIRTSLDLGMSEYFAALEAYQGEFCEPDPNELLAVLKILWCHSFAEEYQLTEQWQEIVQAMLRERPIPDERDIPNPLNLPEKKQADEVLKDSTREKPPETQSSPVPPSELSPLPIQTPDISTEFDDVEDIETYWPVSRRSMAYIWRFLRRPIPDGPCDIFDVRETVEQCARQGFFMESIYRRREVNHAQLILLIDQDGSMMPFHRFTRDLVETAQDDTTLDACSVYYFHNVPSELIYQDRYLTETIALKTVLQQCTEDTSVLIVSDAGAARGYRDLERIKATTQILLQVEDHTSLIGWLNPMPIKRWRSSSAEIIAKLVPMQPMDSDGFSNVIDVVRGQPIHHIRNRSTSSSR